MTRTVNVETKAGRYDVLIGSGLLPKTGESIAPMLARPRTVVITDETVADLYGKTLLDSLQRAGVTTDIIRLAPGEATKSLAQLEHLADQLLALGVERTDTLIALGGGVIGDLVGFAAATLHRGMSFIQIPTTLLAQVDSSVGGKTAVNLPSGKNMVGAFHQPKLVLADLDVLSTLPLRERRAGYAEVVKYGALGDLDFYRWLTAAGEAILKTDTATLEQAVAHCVQMKADVVREDEREKGRRALLNLGHTFGHALEAAHGYDGRLLHGEAVAIGMVIASALSERLGMSGEASPHVPEPLEAHLKRLGFKTRIADLDIKPTPDQMIAAMGKDKKVSGGEITFILGPLGAAQTVRGVPDTELRAVLAASRETV